MGFFVRVGEGLTPKPETFHARVSQLQTQSMKLRKRFIGFRGLGFRVQGMVNRFEALGHTVKQKPAASLEP